LAVFPSLVKCLVSYVDAIEAVRYFSITFLLNNQLFYYIQKLVYQLFSYLLASSVFIYTEHIG